MRLGAGLDAGSTLVTSVRGGVPQGTRCPAGPTARRRSCDLDMKRTSSSTMAGMILVSIMLPSPDPRRLADFYQDVLELPTRQVGDVFDVRVGQSTLRLSSGPDRDESHHLAFTIPTSKLPAAKTWLSDRVELLSRDGRTEFTFDPPFGPAVSVYFIDPDGSILELIARDWPVPGGGSNFDPVADIAVVGEAAIPITSVSDGVDQLGRLWGLQPILDSPEFAAVGDHHGMFILVKPQRPWFPTENQLPNTSPLTISVDLGTGLQVPPITFANGSVATVS